METLLERYRDQIVGQISCFDRVMILGHLPDICYSDAVMRYFFVNNLRICAYAEWSQTLAQEIRDNAARLARDHKLTIHHIRKVSDQRKEDIVAGILEERGKHPGLVCISLRHGTLPLLPVLPFR